MAITASLLLNVNLPIFDLRIFFYIERFSQLSGARSRAWYGMEEDFSIILAILPFHTKIFHSMFRPVLKFSSIFHSILPYHVELVVQNLRREPHSSASVRRGGHDLDLQNQIVILKIKIVI